MGPGLRPSVSALFQQRLNQHARRSHRPKDVPKRTQVRDNCLGRNWPQGYDDMNDTTKTQTETDAQVIREVVERLAKRDQSTNGHMASTTTAIQQALGLHRGYAQLLNRAANSRTLNLADEAIDKRFINAINVVATDDAVRGKPYADLLGVLADVVAMSPTCRQAMAAYAERVQMQAESTVHTKSQTVRAWGQTSFVFSQETVKPSVPGDHDYQG